MYVVKETDMSRNVCVKFGMNREERIKTRMSKIKTSHKEGGVIDERGLQRGMGSVERIKKRSQRGLAGMKK